jgi:hypothetical protein
MVILSFLGVADCLLLTLALLSALPARRVAGWPVGGVGRSALLAPFLYSKPRTAALSWRLFGTRPRVCQQVPTSPTRSKPIFYILCRGGLSAKPGAESRGRLPRTDPRQACPLSPKTDENQYFISDVAAGYLPGPGPNLAGGCPEPSPAKPARFRQKLLKINILYSMSQRAICPAQGRISRGGCPNQLPPRPTDFAKSR